MILKICLIILIIIAGVQGSSYLFNHVDPWLSIGLSILCVGLVLQIGYNISKTYFKKPKNH